MIDPLLILLIGVVVLIAMILALKLNAFIALVSSAMLMSLLSPGDVSDKIGRVAVAFGNVCGGIGIVIALAAVIGICLMESGAADRIVRSFLKVLGEKRAPIALMGSGFLLSVPVFFDTVFYLLVPIARSLHRKTKKNYMLYLLATVAGGALTHTLVPPTPGPLYMASAFGIDLGTMMGVGAMVALPAALMGLVVCKVLDRKLQIPMRSYGDEQETAPLSDDDLPSLWLSLLPIILPVILITANTGAKALEASASVTDITSILGNPNLALLFSAAISMYLLVSQRKLSRSQLSEKIDKALMSGGLIILITAGGGAFGAMLRDAGLKESVASWVSTGGDNSSIGISILFIAFGVASMLKFAQGSTTVSLITSASMFGAMGLTAEGMGFHMVYLATAIGSGAMIGDWMNNSGFWIFSRMSVITETETLKSWTVLTAFLGVFSMIMTLLLATVMPLV